MKSTLVGLAALFLIVAACGGTNNNPPVIVPDAGTDAGTDAGIDAGVDAGTDAGTDAGVDAGDGSTLTDAGCFLNPVTNLEILNACTDAGTFDKTVILPLLQSDGGLPPLPGK
jgi:hypothetical protein